MSSVDAVGRYFPLTLVALLPSDARPAQVFLTSAAWFATAELLLLEVLDQPFDFLAFDQRVSQLGSPHLRSERVGSEAQTGRLMRVPSGVRDDFAAVCPILVDTVLASFRPGYSLWWTVGSEVTAANCMICEGLPRDNNFASLLTAGAEPGAEPAFPRHREGGS
jgi:type VI secretion system protein ImpM